MSDTIIAALISGFFSLIVGFFTGYTFCIKFNSKKIMQQKAGDNSKQVQIGDMYEK